MSKLLISKSLWSPADPTISCSCVDVIILFGTDCHTLITLITVCMPVLGTIFVVCPCVSLIWMSLWWTTCVLFGCVSSLLILLLLLFTLSMESVYTVLVFYLQDHLYVE